MTLKLHLNGFNLNPGDLGFEAGSGPEREEACLSNTFAFVIIKAAE